MKIKINPKELISICELVEGKGKDIDGNEVILNNDCLITVEGEGLRIKAIDKLKAVYIDVFLKCKIIENGSIAVGDLQEFISFLNRFLDDNEINIESDGTYVTLISGKKKAAMPLITITSIESNKGADTIGSHFYFENGFLRTKNKVFDTKVKLKSDELKGIILDGDVVKYRKYPFTITDGGFNVKVGDDRLGYFETKIFTTELTGNAKALYSHGLESVLNHLDGEIMIYLATDAPLFITQNSEIKKIFVSIAPEIDD